MKHKLLTLLVLMTISVIHLQAHPFNASSYIIIDTDGGIDDFRALCLLLSAPDVRVLAVTVSSGVLPAEKAAVKVRALLNSFHHNGIPVAVNKTIKDKVLGCGPAVDFQWGDETFDSERGIISIDSLGKWIEAEVTKKVSWIQLGSLSTILYLHQNFPEIHKNTEKILWSSEARTDFGGFNHQIDTTLVRQIKTLPVPLTVIQGEGNYALNFAEQLKEIWSPTADAFAGSFNDITAKSPFGMRSYDEMTALYLHFPDKFKVADFDSVQLLHYESESQQAELMKQILAEYHDQTYQMMQTMPQDINFYQADIQKTATEIMYKYGMTEWVSAVNTFELHRHIGIYALIGAKMGVRAMEYFGAGIDELNVVSLAGYGPPVSCMNDGIQVSTGATLGHGLIKVMEDNPQPSAKFTYLGKTIQLSLRPAYRSMIANEIKELVRAHGLESDQYWIEVRKNALRYWLGMDRQEMFDIVEL
jgi:pyrimidine-specific ribonucleoside hydrolase